VREATQLLPEEFAVTGGLDLAAILQQVHRRLVPDAPSM